MELSHYTSARQTGAFLSKNEGHKPVKKYIHPFEITGSGVTINPKRQGHVGSIK